MSATSKEYPLRVVLIANRTLIRLGIRTLLKGHVQTERLDEVTHAEAALTLARVRPHVVLYDMDDTQGDLSLLANMGMTAKASSWIVLTGHRDLQLIRRVYEAGAGAVLLKQEGVDTLLDAIEHVRRGEIWKDRPEYAPLLTAPATSSTSRETPPCRMHLLTPRESEVVQGIVKGYRNKRIAEELGISEVTVRHHLTAIFSKLRVTDRLGLLIYATKSRQLVST
ncbi:MAG: response regulator transcription factor [Nitrospiraceae bacterium]